MNNLSQNHKEVNTETIETLRHKLIKCGLEEGLNSKNTIKLSQTLDRYIVEYQLKNINR